MRCRAGSSGHSAAQLLTLTWLQLPSGGVSHRAQIGGQGEGIPAAPDTVLQGASRASEGRATNAGRPPACGPPSSSTACSNTSCSPVSHRTYCLEGPKNAESAAEQPKERLSSGGR